MAFVRIPGLNGKVFVPEKCPARLKKHPCPDCCDCQRCSDDRCRLCRAPDPEQSQKAGPRPCNQNATDGSDQGIPEGGVHG